MGVAGGDQHELGAPRHLTGAFDVEGGVLLGPREMHLTGLLVDLLVARLGPEQRGDHLAVRVQHPRQIRVRPRTRPVRVEQPVIPGLFARQRPVQFSDPLEHARRGQVAGASVQVVVTSHRPFRKPQLRPLRHGAADQLAQTMPHGRMGQLGFDPPTRPVIAASVG